MKIKVSIISFQNAHNYGAILQAFGLQSFIQSLDKVGGVDFIPYYPSYLSERYNPFQKKTFISFIKGNTIKGCFSYVYFAITASLRNYSLVNSARRLLRQSKTLISDRDKLGSNCDLLVCGSDQIWNKALTKDYDGAFFGIGDYPNAQFKISYAASTELSGFEKQDEQIIKPLLHNLNYISVREQSFKDLLDSFVEQPIKVCVDPTILCGSEPFKAIAKKPRKKSKYVLVYAYNPDDKLIKEVINTIPGIDDYEVEYLLLGMPTPKQFFSKHYHSCVSVEQFLGLFQEASFVVTNSFHGLAFSLLFEKNFNVTKVSGKEGRCVGLLQSTGLISRFIADSTEVDWSDLDYKQISKSISFVRASSIEYLSSIVNNIQK